MIVGEHLKRQAQERPDKVAVICNEVRNRVMELFREEIMDSFLFMELSGF